MEKLKKQLQQNYATWGDFLKEQGPRQLMVNYDDVQRIADVFVKNPVTLDLLSEIFHFSSAPAGMDYLQSWLLFLNEFLNINKGIPQAIVSQLAYTIYKRHSSLTLADLKLVFDFILESRYGTFYGSVDTQRIVSSFAEYARERKEIETKIKEREREMRQIEEQKDRAYVPADLSIYPNISKFLKTKM